MDIPVTFMWPQFLWLLLAVPVLVAVYIWLLRRKKKLALRYASLSIVKEAMGAGMHWRRHVPPILFLLAITAMLLAASRPFAVISLPSTQETIILAMDVSGSMRATDVKPNRLVASQDAAKAFLKDLPRNVRVGIVAFAGTASVVQPPTLSREDLVTAIDGPKVASDIASHGFANNNPERVFLAGTGFTHGTVFRPRGELHSRDRVWRRRAYGRPCEAQSADRLHWLRTLCQRHGQGPVSH